MTAAEAGERPLLTVVTVVYDDLEGLKQTFASLEAQRCRDFQWRVLDGASSDGSPAWLAELAASGLPRFDYRSEPDRSLFDAMNRAIRRLDTDYCLFLNAGDTFLDGEVLGRVLPVLQAERPVVAYGRVRMGAFGGRPAREIGRRLRARWELFLGRMPCHQTLFLSRRVFEEFRGYDESLGVFADTEWLMGYSSLLDVGRFRYFDFPMVHYRPGGRSYTHFVRHWRAYLRALARWAGPVEWCAGLLGFAKGCLFKLRSEAWAWRQQRGRS